MPHWKGCKDSLLTFQIEELLQNPEWVKRLEEAKNFREVEMVLRRFAEAKKLRIKEM